MKQRLKDRKGIGRNQYGTGWVVSNDSHDAPVYLSETASSGLKLIEAASLDPFRRRKLALECQNDPEILMRAALDPDDVVSDVFWGASKLNEEVAERLASDFDPVVRLRVADHDGAPVDVLRRLTVDPSSDVESAAQSTLFRIKSGLFTK